MKKLLIIGFILLLISCKSTDESSQLIQGYAIGTSFTVRYLGEDKDKYAEKIDSLIDVINQSASTYIPTSTLSKINKGDTSITIDKHLKEILIKSKKIYKETERAFDPTVGILVNAWGFGPEKPIENIDSLDVKKLLKFVGLDKVKIENNKIIKEYPEIYLDFNALAKGYLVDMVGRMFEAANVENYLVEIGGEIRARGFNDKGKPWKIAIENPNTDGTRSFAAVIELSNESMATSGNYRKYKITADGKKYVHTLNSGTGFPIESDLLSASVISKSDCADVDGYATALMEMGFKKSVLFLKKHPELKAYLIYSEKDKIKTYTTENMEL